MSDRSLKRIKQIRQKTSEGYSPIPIGTQGLLVDMISELDLEEEIRLGGNHYVTVYDTPTSTQITEWYFSEPRRDRELSQMSDYVTYTVSISIVSAIDYHLVVQHLAEEANEDIIWDSQHALVDRVAISEDQERIDISLYKGDFDRLLHSKIIYITTDTETGQVNIDEQVDYEISMQPVSNTETETEVEP